MQKGSSVIFCKVLRGLLATFAIFLPDLQKFFTCLKYSLFVVSIYQMYLLLLGALSFYSYVSFYEQGFLAKVDINLPVFFNVWKLYTFPGVINFLLDKSFIILNWSCCSLGRVLAQNAQNFGFGPQRCIYQNIVISYHCGVRSRRRDIQSHGQLCGDFETLMRYTKLCIKRHAIILSL